MKVILIFLFVVTLAILVFRTVGYMSIRGDFDKEYTREEMARNFKDHKSDFLDLITFFKDNIPQQFGYSISIRQHGEKVSLYLIPGEIVTAEKKVIGAKDATVESRKLDSALNVLGWSRQTLTLLTYKLKKTNCNYISNREYNNNIFDLAPDQEGWGSYSYIVLDRPIVDSLGTVFGEPLGKDSFAIRVVINYSSAL